ncbi:MAG: agglutinin biogenesis protein [Gallionella sp.]|nr:agglutinin biogenesis protein [Gallionella sp.]
MNHYWELVRIKIDGMLLRERVMIFAAVAFLVISSTSTMLLNPILAKQKALSAQLSQQQEKMKSLQAQIQIALQAKKDDEKSPLRIRLVELQRKIQAQDDHLQSRNSRMVESSEIGSMLEQVLGKNGKLKLVALETLPVDSVMTQAKNASDNKKQVFKHGVKITLRGGYLDLLQYLTEVEKAPVQLYWGDVSFSVDKYPDSILILTLYTLSLDKAWLKV